MKKVQIPAAGPIKTRIRVPPSACSSRFKSICVATKLRSVTTCTLSFQISWNSRIYYRLKKLLHHDEMGNLFKVLLAKKKGKKFSLGF